MSVKTLPLFTFALLTSAIAIPCAFAQATSGVNTPSVPSFGTPANNAAGGTVQALPLGFDPDAADVLGALEALAYGSGNHGPVTYGPGANVPGNYETSGPTGPGGGTVTPSPP